MSSGTYQHCYISCSSLRFVHEAKILQLGQEWWYDAKYSSWMQPWSLSDSKSLNSSISMEVCKGHIDGAACPEMMGSGRRIHVLVSGLLQTLLCTCCLLLVVEVAPESKLVEQRPKLLFLCSWVNYWSGQWVLYPLSPKPSVESESDACVFCTVRKKLAC